MLGELLDAIFQPQRQGTVAHGGGKRQLQLPLPAQRLCPFSRLMFEKTPRHIGGDAGVECVISGANEIEKPGHGIEIQYVKVNAL